MRKEPINPNWLAEVDVLVPFHDVDCLLVAWHGHYLKYFEIARTALLNKINYDFPQMKESNIIWPVVEAHIKYIKPATYGLQLKVTAEIVIYEYKLKIDYTIRNATNGVKICKGYTVQVPVSPLTGQIIFQTPPILLECLGLKKTNE